jgi:hypothetical protein
LPGVRTTIWKRIRDRNEGLDLVVMILCLLDVFRSQIDQMSGLQIARDNGEKPAEQPEPEWPRWGAIYQVPLPTDPWQAVPSKRPNPDKRSPWSVQNKPVVW